VTPNVPRQIRYHYSRPGRSVTVYPEWLVIDRPDAKVLLLEAHTGKPFVVQGRTVQDVGAPIVWFVFPGCWYDVGRFHLKDGTFTGWYTNLTTPADISDPADWRCTDLFLDHWTPIYGFSEWLDEAEFAEAVATGVVDRAAEQHVKDESANIARRLRKNDWPPAIAREVTLATVKDRIPA